MYKESSNRKNNPGDLISDEPQKAPCCTQDVRAQSVFFPWLERLLRTARTDPLADNAGSWPPASRLVSLAVKSFNDLVQFFAIKNFSAARHIRVYTKHVHMLQLLHELFHLLLAVRAEAACATASASSWASRSGSSNTRRAGATAAASRSSWANRSRSCSPGPVPVLPVEAAGGLLGAAGWGLGWAGGLGAGAGAGAVGRIQEGGAGAGAGGRGRGLGAGRRAKNFSAARHIRVYTKHLHVLQLLHELFHLLLAVRAEAACAIASASSYASRSRIQQHPPGCQSKQLGQPK